MVVMSMVRGLEKSHGHRPLGGFQEASAHCQVAGTQAGLFTIRTTGLSEENKLRASTSGDLRSCPGLQDTTIKPLLHLKHDMFAEVITF